MRGWKTLPLSLKILTVVLSFWILMSISVVITMPEREIAFFGVLLKGIQGTPVVVLLDIIAPLVFIFAMIRRLRWGAKFGLLYNGIFNLNCILSFIMFKDKFGNGVYFPLIASVIFMLIIYKKREYFSTSY